MYTLETIALVLDEHKGGLRLTATALGMPLHKLKTIIGQNAELQAIVANRDIEIADRSRDVILNVLSDVDIEAAGKLGTAKWALENLASDVYTKKQTIDVTAKPIEELPPEELERRKQAILERMGTTKPEETFNKLELYPTLGPSDASNS